MAGYLEEYAVKGARRSRMVRLWLIGVPLALLLGIFLYFQFRDYPQHRQVKAFLDHLERRDYRGAYALWGCTDAKPCRDYVFDQFLSDWGPQSQYANASQAKIAARKSCEGGVIEFVRFPSKPDVLLWVDRNDSVISYAPWELKTIPGGLENRLREWMWEATRNCKPLIGP